MNSKIFTALQGLITKPQSPEWRRCLMPLGAFTTIAWINARKGLSKSQNIHRLHEHLCKNSVQILLIQEVAKLSCIDTIKLSGFDKIASFGDLAVFASGITTPVLQLFSSNYFLGVDVCGLFLGNVHLSAYRWQDRIKQMQSVQNVLVKRGSKPFLVGGDFNFAPQPRDGMYGEETSKWTHPLERENYYNIINMFNAVEYPSFADCTYTFERRHRSKYLRFRCDFLFSNFPIHKVHAVYNHETRDGPNAFTDHSMVIAKVEV